MNFTDYNIDVLIPALNEEKAIARVIADIPDYVRNIVVVDNNSTDNTFNVAQEAGATTISAEQRGYGNACLTGIKYLQSLPTSPDILVFLDGDYADYPEEMDKILKPVIEEGKDLVIGSRLKFAERGSLTKAQKYGNKLATFLLRNLYNVEFTDLGPFRAIRWEKLMNLGMVDRDYGWTVEMQIKAAKQSLKCAEVPVHYRPRIGKSKVSGTVEGTLMAGYKIILTIIRYI